MNGKRSGAYYELYPGNTNKKIYLFFDEIQDIENWHLFIKRLYEQKKYHIVITGSSARLLSKEIAAELRGRSLTIKFFPLNFSEFLNFKNFPLIDNIEYSQERFQLINYAAEFLTYGGFPRVTMEPSHQRKKDLLNDYLDMIIFKDAQNFECDFIITEAEKAAEAIQVTHQLNRDNSERELRGLKSALKELGLKKGTIITADTEDEIIDASYHISIIPYWKWMIS